MSYVFAKGDHDLGCVEESEHEIKLTYETPFRQPYKRVPQGQLEEFRIAIQYLLHSGIVRESKSPFALPLVLVRKKTGDVRVSVVLETKR